MLRQHNAPAGDRRTADETRARSHRQDSTTRILPEIDGGVLVPEAPAPVPAVHLSETRGYIGVATGWHALALAQRRGRARWLRRMADRVRAAEARKAAEREARRAYHREGATLAAAFECAEHNVGAR